ncbi:hypothetical protein [Alkalihalobacillus sp. 1P02AB]|uniref:hypothetical protein n=1 Tax=Alkalihalobacillus sp. 1P02AB TaxID=3132260 RepID=UPI0039A6C612
MSNAFKTPILIGILFFLIAVPIFLFIDSPQPFLAGLFVAFLIFEISFFHNHNKQKEKHKS